MSLDNEAKFETLSPAEATEHVTSALSDNMKTHLERDVNKEILEKLISDAFSNRLFKNRQAQVIVNSIVKKFNDAAMTGTIERMLYVGGADKFEYNEDHDKHQKALFLTIGEDGSYQDHTDYWGNTSLLRVEKVWGRFPGFDETDEFLPGHMYDIEISSESKMWKGEMRTFENLAGYKLVKGARDELRDWILDSPSLNDELAEALQDNNFSPNVMTMLDKKVKWQNVIVDFFVEGVRAQKKSIRVRDGTGYKNEFQDELLPINFVSDTQVPNIVFSLTGSAKLPSGKKLIFYLNFYPQRMGQYFVSSPLLADLVESDEFQNETPEHQADLLNLILKGTQFRGLGQARKLTASDGGDKLITTIGGISLVEVVE